MTKKQKIVVLTEIEKALLFGSLLGDATLKKRGESYRLRMSHSEQQKDYVMWKYEKLKRLCETTQPPTERITKKGFKSWEFYTSSGSWLKEVFDTFYVKAPNGKYVKTVTDKTIEALTQVSAGESGKVLLATLFMDDGSVRNDCYAGKIATQGFSQGECVLLQGWLFTSFNIQTTVARHTKESGQYYLSVITDGFRVLITLIENVVSEIPEMTYKLNKERKPRND